MTEQQQSDWATAEVSAGELTVALDAEPPRPSREVLAPTATRLGAGPREKRP